MRTKLLPAAALLLATACFHQVVNTGLTPAPKTVEKPWVATWVWGLIPATPIDVRSECPGGVAVVETQQSFANGLVGALTLGLYAPQTAKITCATSANGAADMPADATRIEIPKTATTEQSEQYVNDAIRRSIESHKAVVLTF